MYSVSYYWCELYKTSKYFKTLHEATQFTLSIPTGSVYGVFKEDDNEDDDTSNTSIEKN